MLRPALSASLSHWRADWKAEQKAALARQQELAAAAAKRREEDLTSALTAKQRTEHPRSHWEATGTAGAHQLARASTAAEAPRHD